MRNLINRYARVALSASAVLVSLFMTGLLSGCMGYGEKEPDNPAPSISSLNATQAKQQTWQLSANVSNTDGVKSCGYYVGKDNSLKDAVLVNGSLSGSNVVASYEAQEYGVSYYYKAFVSNGRTEVCSSVGSFKMSSIPVTSVELSSNELNLAPGGNAQLTASVLPSNATVKTLTWSTSDNSVAKVSDNGLVTAVANGSCTITATAHNGVKAECQVTVKTVSYTDLSSSGTANCYIVSSQGGWKFKATVKGNSTESVGSPTKAEVLWETFGTSTKPNVGDVVSNVSYSGGYVSFTSGKDGNAVIAVKDASGTILWSWHIWVCEGYDPKATQQTYNNGAGIMMDRNLGATSASKGSVGALGLLYQWGRKDPFLGGCQISYSSSDNQQKASSTLSWPSAVSSSSSTGTIAYAVSHPTTFITYNSSNYDWYYTGSSSTDNTRWQSSKTKYDPCPPGYRVPDGGSSGVWSAAFGTSSGWTTSSNWDSTNRGMNFGSTDRKLGSGVIWYPAAGCLSSRSGSLSYVGSYGYYWSCTPNGYDAFSLYFSYNGSVYPSNYNSRAYGQSVRCLSESSTPVVAVTSVELDKSSATLSPGGTLQLTASVLPSNATVKTLTWSTSDNSVAKVSDNGLVTAVSNGSCIITATANNGVKAECNLTVEKAAGNDLSSSGTANCYIVSSKGDWKFKATVKGNSTESVGSPSKAEVLWETFGTSTKPNVGDVVSNVSYSGGYVSFTSGKDGNAVIAVKDASGTILWSWHIWVCEGYDPKATQQTYNNDAGIMMDRNLGATSASKGSVGALGLLYQWGRKDPFLGSSSISSSTAASSTLSWPSAVESSSSTGTIAYAVSHPTTFIKINYSNNDWYYTGSSSTDDTRWQSSKTKYDPCPPGYRVPEGGSSGVWSVAFGTSRGWTTSSNWDSTNKGINCGSTDRKLGSGVIWYPAAGYRDYSSGSFINVGERGYYWSCTPYGNYEYFLHFSYNGHVNPSDFDFRASDQSVRCMKE